MNRHSDVAAAGLACVGALRDGRDTDAAVELLDLLQFPLVEVLAWLFDQVLIRAGNQELTEIAELRLFGDLTPTDLVATVAATRKS